MGKLIGLKMKIDALQMFICQEINLSLLQSRHLWQMSLSVPKFHSSEGKYVRLPILQPPVPF